MSRDPDHTAASGHDRVTVAVSMGDPFGIGPEIVAEAVRRCVPADRPLRAIVFGSADILARAALAAGFAPPWAVISLRDWRKGACETSGVVVVDDPVGDAPPSTPGPTAHGGRSSFAWVERAIEACRLPEGHPGRADAMVTAPISKTSWHLAGRSEHPGHTELLASRFGAERHGMLFVGPSLRVMLVTIHVPLRIVSGELTSSGVLNAIELAHEACTALGVASPRIAVCGLNPHAGEGGLLGSEDDLIISPAVRSAAARGILAVGPLAADSLFRDAAAPPIGKGLFDCVVAMYHDQGLIPAKLLDGMKTVNVTTGLPVPRTSPAHGTAFDIAGKNLADATSMIEALKLAARMARQRRRGVNKA
ncbi:MAG: 4-hydroxythreonine-4-phosphate dehydrogenase PdxA [Phycisphaerales bacterium]